MQSRGTWRRKGSTRSGMKPGEVHSKGEYPPWVTSSLVEHLNRAPCGPVRTAMKPSVRPLRESGPNTVVDQLTVVCSRTQTIRSPWRPILRPVLAGPEIFRRSDSRLHCWGSTKQGTPRNGARIALHLQDGARLPAVRGRSHRDLRTERGILGACQVAGAAAREGADGNHGFSVPPAHIQLSTFRPSNAEKSPGFDVTRINRLVRAIAAIWPSTNGGVLPVAVRRARSQACQSAAFQP